MVPQPTAFGALLRHFRGRASLTQARLAERAGLSVDAIIKLEGGKRQAPRCETVQLLARTLHLTAPERHTLEDAARPHRYPEGAVTTASLPISALLQCLTEMHTRQAALINAFVAADATVDPGLEANLHHQPIL